MQQRRNIILGHIRLAQAARQEQTDVLFNVRERDGRWPLKILGKYDSFRL